MTEPIPRLVGAGLVLRKAAIEQSGWLDGFVLTGRSGAQLGAGDDSELLISVRRAGYEAWYAPDLLLDHYIPAARLSLQYLCLLNYGFGQSRPYLQLMAGQIHLDSIWHRAHFLTPQMAGLAWYTARWLISAMIRSAFEPDRRIDWYQVRVRARASLRLALGANRR